MNFDILTWHSISLSSVSYHLFRYFVFFSRVFFQTISLNIFNLGSLSYKVCGASTCRIWLVYLSNIWLHSLYYWQVSKYTSILCSTVQYNIVKYSTVQRSTVRVWKKAISSHFGIDTSTHHSCYWHFMISRKVLIIFIFPSIPACSEFN